MRQVIPNIGAVTHKITKYLNKLLSALTKSEYKALNIADLIRKLKKRKNSNWI